MAEIKDGHKDSEYWWDCGNGDDDRETEVNLVR